MVLVQNTPPKDMDMYKWFIIVILSFIGGVAFVLALNTMVKPLVRIA
jgi:hypothetical protein